MFAKAQMQLKEASDLVSQNGIQIWPFYLQIFTIFPLCFFIGSVTVFVAWNIYVM